MCDARIASPQAEPEATVMSLDGISAFDLISENPCWKVSVEYRVANKCCRSSGCFSPSVHLWEDDSGVVHHIRQGEGDDQGDPLMPLGQHSALVSI